MTQLTHQLTGQGNATKAEPAAPADPAARAERRRPGRLDHVNPALIPLLRRDGLFQALLRDRDDDDLRGVRGVGLSLVIGLAIWAALGLLAWWWLAR